VDIGSSNHHPHLPSTTSVTVLRTTVIKIMKNGITRPQKLVINTTTTGLNVINGSNHTPARCTKITAVGGYM